jgi:hypothetical protein
MEEILFNREKLHKFPSSLKELSEGEKELAEILKKLKIL